MGELNLKEFLVFLDDILIFSESFDEHLSRLEAVFKLVEAPPPAPNTVIFIAGRPKATLLFWFFGDFRCGALLFMVIHVIYKYKNR